MRKPRKSWPTDDELLANLREVYADVGHLTYWIYKERGDYSVTTVEKRFGSWLAGCTAAGIDPTKKVVKVVAKSKTWCIRLDCGKWFERPADDPSCRVCPACRPTKQWEKPVQEGWEILAC